MNRISKKCANYKFNGLNYFVTKNNNVRHFIKLRGGLYKWAKTANFRFN